jgi:DNA-binding protein YbaB
MELFKMAKEAISMRNKISEIDKKLKSRIIDVEHKGVKIKLNAKNEFLSLSISEDLLKREKSKIEKSILSAFEEARKKVQNTMTEEAKNFAGKIKIPGL